MRLRTEPTITATIIAVPGTPSEHAREKNDGNFDGDSVDIHFSANMPYRFYLDGTELHK
tara:strand:+ start:205 stop:381 length:177 start_codon:yes stop_codon:yes gene_type:complete